MEENEEERAEPDQRAEREVDVAVVTRATSNGDDDLRGRLLFDLLDRPGHAFLRVG